MVFEHFSIYLTGYQPSIIYRSSIMKKQRHGYFDKRYTVLFLKKKWINLFILSKRSVILGNYDSL